MASPARSSSSPRCRASRPRSIRTFSTSSSRTSCAPAAPSPRARSSAAVSTPSFASGRLILTRRAGATGGAGGAFACRMPAGIAAKPPDARAAARRAAAATRRRKRRRARGRPSAASGCRPDVAGGRLQSGLTTLCLLCCSHMPRARRARAARGSAAAERCGSLSGEERARAVGRAGGGAPSSWPPWPHCRRGQACRPPPPAPSSAGPTLKSARGAPGAPPDANEDCAKPRKSAHPEIAESGSQTPWPARARVGTPVENR